MNQVSTEQLDALLQQFGPRRREAFSALKPHNDVIEGLRAEYMEMPGMRLRVEQVQRLGAPLGK